MPPTSASQKPVPHTAERLPPIVPPANGDAARSNVSLLLTAGKELEARSAHPNPRLPPLHGKVPTMVSSPISSDVRGHLGKRALRETVPSNSPCSSHDQLVPHFYATNQHNRGEPNMSAKKRPIDAIGEADNAHKIRRKPLPHSSDVDKSTVKGHDWGHTNPGSLHHILAVENSDSRVPVMR